jgi:hypothetical protein
VHRSKSEEVRSDEFDQQSSRQSREATDIRHVQLSRLRFQHKLLEPFSLIYKPPFLQQLSYKIPSVMSFGDFWLIARIQN